MILFRKYILLCRFPISLFAACSALTGYLLAPGRDLSTILLLAAGVLLLASGASALNQYQERDIDALMRRTRLRPLPAGTMTPFSALVAAIGLMVCGLLALGMTGPAVAALGAFAVLWYNGLYTPLKRKTVFAAVPGALVGAVPPLMGWSAGGGSLADPKILAVAALFIIWQIPHFWTILLRNEADYELAGLPVLTRVIPRERFVRITRLWTASSAVTGLLMPLFGVMRSPAALVLLVVLSGWLAQDGFASRSVSPGEMTASASGRSTLFLFLFMALASADAALRGG